MFFNSFNKRMKSAYNALDSHAKTMIFPKGEDEFIYVATLLNNHFKNKELTSLFPIYGSVRTFVALEKGNYYYIVDYSKRKMPNFSDEEVFTMIGIAMSTMIPGINYKDTSSNLLEKCKYSIKSELDIMLQINEHLDIFATKNDSKVGTIDNPLLLPGLSGVEKYFDKLVTNDGEEVSYKRTNCVHLTDNATNINYALDEYEIYLKKTNVKICSLYINEYGTTTCEFCPSGFKLKN